MTGEANTVPSAAKIVHKANGNLSQLAVCFSKFSSTLVNPCISSLRRVTEDILFTLCPCLFEKIN